jgi:hypothetical protein
MRGLFLIVAALVAGCASTSGGVIAAGPDTYKVGATAYTSMGGAGTAKADAYRKAEAECAKQGRRAEVVDEATKVNIAAGNVDVTFRCVAR